MPSTPNERGFEAVWQAESRLVREATVPMAAYAAVTSRIKVGSGVIPIWTRNVGLLAATFSTLDELAPGRIILGLGAWWEPLASKVGRGPAPAAAGHARGHRGDPAAARLGAGHLPRRVRAPRRRRDRHRARRPLAAARADLHRRDRNEDDGAGRRDRRRRACSTTWSAPTTTSGHSRRSRLARRGQGGPSRTSTGRSWSSARSTTTATPRSTAPASCSPSTSGSSRTS